MGDQQPTAIRVSFGKNETEWQKKKRESSAQVNYFLIGNFNKRFPRFPLIIKFLVQTTSF